MLYQKTLQFLYSQLPMFQRIGKLAYRADLTKTRKVLDILNNPQKALKTIHIAGTNGKGSTSHMLAAILQTAGYKTGLYTSPHLKDFRERIRVNGKPISKMYVVEFVKRNRASLKKIRPSFFEMTVGLAFEYFKKEEVDIAVIETGLGGRLDSTNVIYPEVSIITNIGLDHTDILGDTISKIAKEKAGIIKRWAPVVISETNELTKEIFKEIAKKRSSKIYFADELFSIKNIRPPFKIDGNLNFDVWKGADAYIRVLELDLIGIYQSKNILGVLQAVEILREKGYIITDLHIKRALSKVKKMTGFMGRWQMIDDSPLTMCDVAHNVDGITEVLKQVALTPHENLHFVFGMVKEKDITKVLSILPKNATYYFCNANLPRALDANELREQASLFDLNGAAYSSVKEALKAAQKAANFGDDLVLVSGSTFVVAEAL